MNYLDFASKISFYEFLQNEFKKPQFNTRKYKEEIDLLKKNINIEYLTKILSTNPKIIDIFEELFQLQRFTNTQYINFCFDVNVLNNYEENLIIKYIKTRIFKFENGKENTNFLNIFSKIIKPTSVDNKKLIYAVKRAIIEYIDKCQNTRTIFYSHIENSIDTRLRIAKYLIENLSADEYISSINLEKYLKNKRHPIDTKGLHGNFGIMKICKVLNDCGFQDANNIVEDKNISIKNSPLNDSLKNKFSYVREKMIRGINKQKDGKPKVFDFVLMCNGIPKVLVETNFFTTSGTKIGINQGEYVDLLEDINRFNKKENMRLKFIWITDGNYWLTKDGETRFTNLKNNYFKDHHSLLNYNLFKENIELIKKEIRNY